MRRQRIAGITAPRHKNSGILAVERTFEDGKPLS